mmetsp:Transcript_10692/g.31516  ORF Transcript_10692/g.31516 Transcript_10692/m.31516 type:complete len:300 (+) Transcript_10692:278-1177(+)
MCFARSFERRWAALWKGRRSAGSCGMKSLRQSSTTAAACKLIATRGASITPHLTLGDGTWPGLSAARPLSYSSRPHSRIASASSDSSSLGYLASSAAFFSAAALSAAAFSAAAASIAACHSCASAAPPPAEGSPARVKTQSFNEEEWTLRTSLEWWRSGGPSRDRGVQPAAAPPPSSHKRCTPPSRRGKPAAARGRGLMGERGGGVSVVTCEYVLTSTPASAAMVGSRSRCEVAHAVEVPAGAPRQRSRKGTRSPPSRIVCLSPLAPGAVRPMLFSSASVGPEGHGRSGPWSAERRRKV